MSVDPHFMTLLSTWIKYDTVQIKAQEELKTMRKEKNLISDEIMQYMKQNDIDKININGVELRFNSTPKQRGLSKQLMTEGLIDSGMLKNQRDVDKLVEYLYTLKKTDEYVETLKRSKSKK